MDLLTNLFFALMIVLFLFLVTVILPDNNGPVNRALICPHCGARGMVRTKPVRRRKGIDGAKAIGGLLTGGLSIAATGISRQQKQTQAHCDNCDSTWDF